VQKIHTAIQPKYFWFVLRTLLLLSFLIIIDFLGVLVREEGLRFCVKIDTAIILYDEAHILLKDIHCYFKNIKISTQGILLQTIY